MTSSGSISQLLQKAAQSLHGRSDAPRLDAERLLFHAFQTGASQPLPAIETSWLYAHGEELVPAETGTIFFTFVNERKQGKPLAYILGEWDFYGRTFFVNTNVLVPRPETEELVRQALQTIQRLPKDFPLFTIADIGTGSGCILITLALELADLGLPLSRFTFLATDISTAALGVAKQNAKRHGLLNQIEFLSGTMLEPLKGRSIDLILSNPPYLPSKELDQAGQGPDTAGLLFEPRTALEGGWDGQTYVKKASAWEIPALVEGTGGEIRRFNWPKEWLQSAEK